VLLHLAPGTKEDTASCTAFFQDLKRRGLADPLLVVTDGAAGLIRAAETCFPRAVRQRCLVHRLRNLRSKAPDSQWLEIAIRARACYEAASPALATLLRDDFVQACERELPALVKCFLEDFDACFAHLRFPLGHRKVIRTTNLLERLFLEERRRTKIVPHAFGERPVLKLMYAAIIRAADRWRGITVGELEQRQLRAIREELNHAHAQQRVAPAVTAKPTSPVRKLRGGRRRPRRASSHLAPDQRSPGGPLPRYSPSRSVHLDTACIAGSIIQQRWDLTLPPRHYRALAILRAVRCRAASTRSAGLKIRPLPGSAGIGSGEAIEPSFSRRGHSSWHTIVAVPTGPRSHFTLIVVEPDCGGPSAGTTPMILSRAGNRFV
jgi:hypothetical protein